MGGQGVRGSTTWLCCAGSHPGAPGLWTEALLVHGMCTQGLLLPGRTHQSESRVQRARGCHAQWSPPGGADGGVHSSKKGYWQIEKSPDRVQA